MSLPSHARAFDCCAGARYADISKQMKKQTTHLIGLMNDTKWDELRLAMHRLGKNSPKWRTMDVESGYLSAWDGDWFYHFRTGEYKTIAYVEIRVTDDASRDLIRHALADIHVPGHENEEGFVVFGYKRPGEPVDFIKTI